jgi:hypothetical protein
LGKKQSKNQRPRPTASPPTRSKASGATPTRGQHWRKSLAWSGGVVTAVIVGVLISVLSSQASRIIPQPSPSPENSTSDGQASPKIVSRTPVSSISSASASSVRPDPNPLTVISEDPINVDDINDWVFPTSFVLDAGVIKVLNASLAKNPAGNYVPDYLYGRGGYETNQVDTQLVVQNNQSVPLRIIDIGVVKTCTSQLGGTLFYAPGQAEDPGVKLGFDLDSPYPVARKVHGNYLSKSAPYYFADYTVTISPGAQQVFDLFAQARNQACSFRYRVTILEGDAKVYQIICDGSQAFRVSGLKPGYSKYPVIYAGGAFSPTYNAQFGRVDPNKFNVLDIP